MNLFRFVRRAVGIAVVVALAAMPLFVLTAAPSGAVPPEPVGTPAQLKAAWENESITEITLTADIELGNSSSTCFGSQPFRDVGGTGIVVDGQGLYGITSTCDFGRLLTDWGTESVTLTGLTHFDDGTRLRRRWGPLRRGPGHRRSTRRSPTTPRSATRARCRRARPVDRTPRSSPTPSAAACTRPPRSPSRAAPSPRTMPTSRAAALPHPGHHGHDEHLHEQLRRASAATSSPPAPTFSGAGFANYGCGDGDRFHLHRQLLREHGGSCSTLQRQRWRVLGRDAGDRLRFHLHA